MAAEEPGGVVIDINEWLVNDIKQNLNAVCGDQGIKAENFTIFRAPAYIRRINEDLFEPRLVSIGPYYCGNENLLAMQEHKWRYRRDFLARNSDNSIEDCVSIIRDLEARARRCYFEPIKLESDEFVEMLLLDGCFIIEYFLKLDECSEDTTFEVYWISPRVWIDLFMIENQIPFFVLQSLYALLVRSSATTSASGSGDQSTFVNIVRQSMIQYDHHISDELIASDQEIYHLLHLYHLSVVPAPNQDPYCLRPVRVTRSEGYIPCATELREAGVIFKKKSEGSFLDITFRDGLLEIPFLSIDEFTRPRFMNLVAFEQSSNQVKRNMTCFAIFMDRIINTSRDVAILQQCGILENQLATDEEVAIFFNHLSYWAYIFGYEHYLARLFRDVNQYCDSYWHRWKAGLKRDYFSNPWTLISLVAAIILLVLAFLQTVFTIYPFYRPRS
ncbi:UPF0481 protein At3g47200-like [Typha angustifolia]|uniref:UPF0481 protein At3g47200-like n=1 Tax=Typha angustifolia TaxID=59011 RepID=UPI003C2D51BC